MADEHRETSEAYIDFLRARPQQEKAAEYGFRPGDPEVPVKTEASPFGRYAGYGLSIDGPDASEFPSPEVIHNLQASWERTQAGR